VTALLVLQGVELRFGGLQALSDVGFAVAAGEVVAVIGPNGAGKTSLFNVITGYAGSADGSILLDGARIEGLTPHAIAALGVRRTFQNGGLFGALTVLENVLCSRHAAIGGGVLATLLRFPGIARRERDAAQDAHRLLEAMHVGHLAGLLARELSGGQQRIVEIVRAIAPTPKLLLLDEPAVGLSPVARADLATIIRQMAGQGVGVLLIEHAIELVMSVSDRIVVLSEGRVIANGTPGEVRGDRQVMEAYLGHG